MRHDKARQSCSSALCFCRTGAGSAGGHLPLHWPGRPHPIQRRRVSFGFIAPFEHHRGHCRVQHGRMRGGPRAASGRSQRAPACRESRAGDLGRKAPRPGNRGRARASSGRRVALAPVDGGKACDPRPGGGRYGRISPVRCVPGLCVPETVHAAMPATIPGSPAAPRPCASSTEGAWTGHPAASLNPPAAAFGMPSCDEPLARRHARKPWHRVPDRSGLTSYRAIASRPPSMLRRTPSTATRRLISGNVSGRGRAVRAPAADPEPR